MFCICNRISYCSVGRRYFCSDLKKSPEKIPLNSWLHGYRDPKSDYFTLKRDCLWIREDIINHYQRGLSREQFINFDNMTLHDISSKFDATFHACVQFDSEYSQPLIGAGEMVNYKHFESPEQMNRATIELINKLVKETNFSDKLTPGCRSHGMRVVTKEMIEFAKKKGKPVETPFILGCDHSAPPESSLRDLFKLNDNRFTSIVIQLSEKEKYLLNLGLFKREKLVCDVFVYVFCSVY